MPLENGIRTLQRRTCHVELALAAQQPCQIRERDGCARVRISIRRRLNGNNPV
jgi:hypothetical protein